eukprot:SAG25_NODE_283_length_10420_cov_9.898382_8_plen_100_part_00
MVIGDSVNDLPAMVAAGVGVLVKEGSSLRQTLEAFGLQTRPLSAILATPDPCGAVISAAGRAAASWASGPVSAPAPLLLTANGWGEVEELMFGSEDHKL